MTEDLDSKDSQSDSGSKTFINKSKDKKPKTHRPLTKIILRRLPSTMTEEAFLEQVSPIPDHDHFYFAKPDPSLGNNLFSRAYINFVNVEDIYLFRDKFDGYVFLDEKGLEYVGIVEYAPFQRVPKKKKKKDPKCGTIESDPVYQEFLDNLNKDQETESQPKLEYSYPIGDGQEKKTQSTPLLEYLASRKIDKRSRDERRRRENDKRKMRIERKTKDGYIKEEDELMETDLKKVKPREWDKEKGSVDIKDENIKLDNKDVNVFESKSYKDQRKLNVNSTPDKKKKPEFEKKEMIIKDEDQEDDKMFKKEKRDKFKESPREQKSKKYSDTRKERIKQADCPTTEKQALINKIISSEGKTKSLNHDDIKPFTQLPQVKTDDLARIIDSMDKKIKLEENHSDVKANKIFNDEGVKVLMSKIDRKTDIIVPCGSKVRRESVESDDTNISDEIELKRQKSMEDRGKSTEREGSEEKDKDERRSERRIRNKDRPSLPIYQPGMGKFSKQRLAKEKEIPLIAKSVSDSEKRDT